MLQRFFLFLILLFAFFYSLSDSFAEDLQSPRFKIELKGIDIQPRQEKEAFYTINSLFGSKAMKDLSNLGYVKAENNPADSISFSLSQSLTYFNLNNQSIDITDFSVERSDGQEFTLALTQNSPFQSFSNDRIELQFSQNDSNYFRKLPLKSNKESPTLISSGKEKSGGRIYFKLNGSTERKEGTYDTIINFIVSPN